MGDCDVAEVDVTVVLKGLATKYCLNQSDQLQGGQTTVGCYATIAHSTAMSGDSLFVVVTTDLRWGELDCWVQWRMA